MGDEFDSDDDFTSQDDTEDTLRSNLDGSDNDVSSKHSKHKCDARRRLELKLEEQRVNKQVQDYDFDDLLDDDFS